MSRTVSPLRYWRRMIKASAAGFVRDEQGSVLALTVVFALPMAMFVLASYNIGVGLTTRMRAQNVADAASYTSSLWESRFLNYCAYTRRQLTANYAVIGLCTAYESMAKMFINIYNSSNLTCFPFPCSSDNGLVHDGMEITYTAIVEGSAHLASSDSYNDSDETNLVRVVRKGADAMNKMLSQSQSLFFASVGATTIPIMQQVVKDANREIGGTPKSGEFTLATGALAAATAGGVNSLNSLVEKKAITKDEVYYYEDFWTRGDNELGTGSLNVGMFGRAEFTGMVGIDPTYCGTPTEDEYIAAIDTWSDGVDIAEDGSTFKTAEHCAGFYVYFWICIDEIGGPIGTAIIGPETKSDYTTDHNFADAQVYQIADGVSGTGFEPSSLAIVDCTTDKMTFFMQDKGLGKLLDPNTLLPSGKQIRAFSRAKTYFSGPGEDIKAGKYFRPHTSYARWGAKLAPLSKGPAVMNVFLAPALAKGRAVEY